MFIVYIGGTMDGYVAPACRPTYVAELFIPSDHSAVLQQYSAVLQQYSDHGDHGDHGDNSESLCVLVTIFCLLANVYCLLKFSI